MKELCINCKWCKESNDIGGGRKEIVCQRYPIIAKRNIAAGDEDTVCGEWQNRKKE